MFCQIAKKANYHSNITQFTPKKSRVFWDHTTNDRFFFLRNPTLNAPCFRSQVSVSYIFESTPLEKENNINEHHCVPLLNLWMRPATKIRTLFLPSVVKKVTYHWYSSLPIYSYRKVNARLLRHSCSHTFPNTKAQLFSGTPLSCDSVLLLLKEDLHTLGKITTLLCP